MSDISKNALENNVSAKGQVKKGPYRIFNRGGNKKILFFGNSITWHSLSPGIGWYGDWGMAASCVEKDYVHLVVSALDEKIGKVDFAIAHASEWERMTPPECEKYLRDTFAPVLDFAADIIVIRLGENMPKDAAPACKDYFLDMIDYFVNGSDAKVVLTDSFWHNSARDEMVREIAGEKGYAFCTLSDLEEDERTMALGKFEHRGVSLHPSDYGMKMIAERIIETMGQVL